MSVLLSIYDRILLSERKNKEESHMKAATYRNNFWNQPYVPYPNAATRRQVLDKMIDRLLIAASCIGIVAVVMFLLTMY